MALACSTSGSRVERDIAERILLSLLLPRHDGIQNDSRLQVNSMIFQKFINQTLSLTSEPFGPKLLGF